MKIVCFDGEFNRYFSSSRREVSPSAPAVTEMETESESSVVSQPPPGTEPENREGCPDEVRSLKGWGGWGGGGFFTLSQTNALPHSLAACVVGRTRQGYFTASAVSSSSIVFNGSHAQRNFKFQLLAIGNEPLSSSSQCS